MQRENDFGWVPRGVMVTRSVSRPRDLGFESPAEEGHMGKSLRNPAASVNLAVQVGTQSSADLGGIAAGGWYCGLTHL